MKNFLLKSVPALLFILVFAIAMLFWIQTVSPLDEEEKAWLESSGENCFRAIEGKSDFSRFIGIYHVDYRKGILTISERCKWGSWQISRDNNGNLFKLFSDQKLLSMIIPPFTSLIYAACATYLFGAKLRSKLSRMLGNPQ